MLKILVVNDVFPHINNRTTIFFKNIVPILSKKFEIKVYWIITDDYGERYKETNPYYEILFLSDFNNACEVIEKIRPDIIYHLIAYSIIDYAFMLAGKFLKIPSFGYCEEAKIECFNDADLKHKQISEYLKQFFMMKNIDGNNSIKNNRGINFIKKILFLMKTIRDLGKSQISSVKETLDFLYFIINQTKSTPRRYSKFNCDLIFADRIASIDTLVEWGLKKENVVIAGNLVYDRAFEESKQPSKSFNKKLNILFLTVNLSGIQGKSIWSKTKREQMIKELIINLKKTNQEILLTIKIHPTSEDYTEYKKLLEPFKNVCLSQIDDVIDLLHKSDVVITSCSSTAGMVALVMKKPIIIWNFFQVEGDMLLRENIVLECKNGTELYDCIKNVESFGIKNREKIDDFVKEKLGEGKAVQKITYELEKWLKKMEL